MDTVPQGLVDSCGEDWRWNARGVYYRHFYSPEWVTEGHDLWIPEVNSQSLESSANNSLKERAKTFLIHALNNEDWNKSEYAWEADAWSDVFGQMRNDPLVAA